MENMVFERSENMKAQILEALDNRELFDVDIAVDIGERRVSVTRYLEKKVDFKDDVLSIEGLGDFHIQEHDIGITVLGFVTIKSPNSAPADLITIM